MATNFPSSLDSLTNPTATSTLSSPSHSAQHANANDAIEALEAKVGVDNSAVTTSLDYKVRNPELVGGGARPLLTGGAYIDGSSGLVMSGLDGNNAETPDSAALDITGDLEIVMRLSSVDWGASTIRTLISKHLTPNRGYEWLMLSGTLRMQFQSGGVDYANQSSTTMTSLSNNTMYWLRLRRAAATGTVTVEYAADASTEPTVWTSLTTIGAQTAGTIDTNTNPLQVGSNRTRVQTWNGIIARTIVRDGFGGTVVFDADFSAEAADTLAFQADTGTGIREDGLVLRGISGEYASTPDSAALSVTGDIDIKIKVTMADWTPSNYPNIIGKWINSGNQRSYRIEIVPSGVLVLYTSPDGAASVAMSSTVATGLADGSTKWIRATLDVNDGAGNRVAKFYLSDDGTTWTQLGTTVTTAGTTSVYDGTAALTIGQTNNGVHMVGTVHRVIVQSAYDTANNTTSLQFDADFDAQPVRTTSFTESSSNAATVTVTSDPQVVSVTTTRYTVGIPGAQFNRLSTFAGQANRDYYIPFNVDRSIDVDMFTFEVTSGPASASTTYLGIYSTDDDYTPNGAPLATTSVAVGSGATGTFYGQITPVTLPPGSYVLTYNQSVATTYRAALGGPTPIVHSLGANMLISQLYRSRTAATFPNPLPGWDTRTGSTVENIHTMFVRWKAA